MSKVKQYIEQATSERIRSRGLIRKVAIEAARIQSQRTAKVVRAGYINRRRNRLDATGIAHGLDYLLTD